MTERVASTRRNSVAPAADRLDDKSALGGERLGESRGVESAGHSGGRMRFPPGLLRRMLRPVPGSIPRGGRAMARLVAAFGSSHSPMLASTIEEWQTVFLARDKARQFVDFDGNACDYETLLARAPADAPERIAP